MPVSIHSLITTANRALSGADDRRRQEEQAAAEAQAREQAAMRDYLLRYEDTKGRAGERTERRRAAQAGEALGTRRQDETERSNRARENIARTQAERTGQQLRDRTREQLTAEINQYRLQEQELRGRARDLFVTPEDTQQYRQELRRLEQARLGAERQLRENFGRDGDVPAPSSEETPNIFGDQGLPGGLRAIDPADIGQGPAAEPLDDEERAMVDALRRAGLSQAQIDSLLSR